MSGWILFVHQLAYKLTMIQDFNSSPWSVESIGVLPRHTNNVEQPLFISTDLAFLPNHSETASCMR